MNRSGSAVLDAAVLDAAVLDAAVLDAAVRRRDGVCVAGTLPGSGNGAPEVQNSVTAGILSGSVSDGE